MAKFDRQVKRILSAKDVDPKLLNEAIVRLKTIGEALKEAISHYSDQEKLNNWNEHWYRNAKSSYEDKLEKLDATILQLEAKRLASPQTEPGVV